MRTMQEKVIEMIEKIVAEDDNLDIVQQAEYANTGVLYCTSGLRTVWTLRYAFQTDYCTLTLSGINLIEEMGLSDNPPAYRIEERSGREPSAVWHALNYTDSARVGHLLELLREACSC